MSSVLHVSGLSAVPMAKTMLVAREIDLALDRSPHCELRKLHVTCEDGVARLTGFVSSYFTKLIAAEAIQVVTPPGWRVYNNVIVRQRSQDPHGHPHGNERSN